MKNENLKPLHSEVRNLLRSIPKHILEYIPRAQNGRADQLSNVAMDTMGKSSIMRIVHNPSEVSDIQVVSVVKKSEDELLTSTTNSSSNVCNALHGFQGEGVSDSAKEENKKNGSNTFVLQVDYSNVIVNYEEQTMTLTVPFSDLKFEETKHTASGLLPTISLLVDTAKMTTIENIVKTKKSKIMIEKRIMSEIKVAERDKKKLEKLMSSSVPNIPSKIPKSKEVVKVIAGDEVAVLVVGEEELKGKKRGGSKQSKRIGMSA